MPWEGFGVVRRSWGIQASEGLLIGAEVFLRRRGEDGQLEEARISDSGCRCRWVFRQKEEMWIVRGWRQEARSEHGDTDDGLGRVKP